MSKFELEDRGEGRFAVKGDMSFDTADQILKASNAVFRQYDSLSVDLSGVGKADSAGLALLLEWKSQAAQRGAGIQYDSVPDSLIAIARTAEVGELI